MKMNKTKVKVRTVSEGQNELNIKIHGVRLEEIDKFNYIRVSIERGGKREEKEQE